MTKGAMQSTLRSVAGFTTEGHNMGVVDVQLAIYLVLLYENIQKL